MYFILLSNDNFSCVRFTGTVPLIYEEHLPDNMRRYFFDDEDLWSDDALSKEFTRVQQGEFYDSYAMCAIDMERYRRDGRDLVPAFDEWNEVLDFWESIASEGDEAEQRRISFEEEDFHEFRVYHSEDFSEETIQQIRKIADAYRVCLELERASDIEYMTRMSDVKGELELAKNAFITKHVEKLAVTTIPHIYVEVGRILAQVYATDGDEDFLYAGLAMLKDGDWSL